MPRLSFFLVSTCLILLSCSISADFDFEIIEEYSIRPSDMPSTTFNRETLVDATEYSEDYEKYKDDVEDIEFNRITYTITYHSGSSSQRINDAKLEIADLSGAGRETIGFITGVNLSNSMFQEVEIPQNSSGVNRFKDLMKPSPHQAMLYLTGTANEAEMDFRVKFIFYCTAKYKKDLI